ncbi:MAG: hypothetical protein L6Q54_00250 [Leptospiraceae bacterium]|nr:hypothetical protein [Leptospiraceae bacterium]
MIIAALATGSGVYYLFREPRSENKEATEGNVEKSSAIEKPQIQRGSEIRVLPYENQKEISNEKVEIKPPEKALDPKRQTKEGNLKKSKKLKLTYDTDEIITKNSRYSFHRRPLLNAELLVEKENYESALEILNRIENRIPDKEIKKKISKNAEDIRNFLDEPDDSFSLEDEKYSKVEIPFQDLVRAIKEITDGISQTVDRGFSIPSNFPLGNNLNALNDATGSSAEDSDLGRKELESGGYKIVAIPMLFNDSTLQKLELDSGGSPKESLFDPEKLFPQNSPPIIYQIFQNSERTHPDNSFAKEPPVQEPRKSVDSKLETEKQESDSSKEKTSPALDTQTEQTKKSSPLDSGGYSGGFGDRYAESKLNDLLNKESLPQKKSDEILESAVFDANWSKFQSLPIKDRRSGIERRKSNERRGDFQRKDRRSGEDRRKNDLFKEREEFLEKKKEEKEEDSLSNFADKKLSDFLPQVSFPPSLQPGYFPFEKLPILLPDPQENEIQIHPLPLPSPVEKQILPEPSVIRDGEDHSKESKEIISPINLSLIDLPIPTDILLKPESSETSNGLPYVVVEKESPPQIQDDKKENEFGKKENQFTKILLPDPVDFSHEEKEIEASPLPQIPQTPFDEDKELPEVEVVDGNLDELEPPPEAEQAEVNQPEPERTIHGILELKPPEADDAPFLTLTYDFGKIPHSFRLSKNHTVMEYSYYKYKPMLMKAQEFARRKMLKNALNYYRVIKSQNIPPELKKMINRNITDITEFMEKYLMAKG